MKIYHLSFYIYNFCTFLLPLVAYSYYKRAVSRPFVAAPVFIIRDLLHLTVEECNHCILDKLEESLSTVYINNMIYAVLASVFIFLASSILQNVSIYLVISDIWCGKLSLLSPLSFSSCNLQKTFHLHSATLG